MKYFIPSVANILLCFLFNCNNVQEDINNHKKQLLYINVLENKSIFFENKEVSFCDLSNVIYVTVQNNDNIEDTVIKFRADTNIEMSYMQCIFNAFGRVGIKNIVVERKGKDEIYPIEYKCSQNSIYNHFYIQLKKDKTILNIGDGGEKTLVIQNLEFDFEKEKHYLIHIVSDIGVSYHQNYLLKSKINKMIEMQQNTISNNLFQLNYNSLITEQKKKIDSIFSVDIRETNCPICL